jgi:hypothetical protein
MRGSQPFQAHTSARCKNGVAISAIALPIGANKYAVADTQPFGLILASVLHGSALGGKWTDGFVTLAALRDLHAV